MILAGSTVILIVLSYLLYDDSLLFPHDASTQPAIGTISSTHNDVRRKNNGHFIWLPGNTQDQVYNQDSIFTGDGSQASIRLSDGSVLQIQENSLVNLNLKNGQMELDLRFGQFVGNGNAPLRVKTGSEEYTIQGRDAKFEINRSRSGALDVKILSGDAQITGKAGKQVLKSNESLQITQKGIEKNQVEANIDLLTPEDLLMYRAADKMPLAFEWEGKGPMAQYQIEIATAEDFKNIVSLRPTLEQKILVKDSLPEGPYFWRVKGLDIRRKLLVTSQVQKFYLSYLLAPKITSPEKGGTLSAEALADSDGILKAATEISWQGTDRHVNYEWQLSTDAEFKSVLASKTAPETAGETPLLEAGTYFARVRGFDKDQHPSPWSEAHSFQFEVSTETKPPAPRLAETQIRFAMPKLEGRAPSATTSPQIAWSPVSVAKKYRWEIAKNPEFAGAQGSETAVTRIAWTQYKPGKYYFRVFSRTALGQSSLPSETGTLEVYGEAPQLNPIPTTLIKEASLQAQAKPQAVRATWSPIAGAASYSVQIAKEENFENPLEIAATGTEGTVPLPDPGKYFVRVQALNSEGHAISDFSKPQAAQYIFKKTYQAPKLIEPYDKNTIFLQKDTEPLIWLEWSSVPDADTYAVEISTRADFSQVVFTKKLSETRLLVRDKVPYGTLYWRVRAVGLEESLSSEWTQREFNILHHKNSGF